MKCSKILCYKLNCKWMSYMHSAVLSHTALHEGQAVAFFLAISRWGEFIILHDMLDISEGCFKNKKARTPRSRELLCHSNAEALLTNWALACKPHYLQKQHLSVKWHQSGVPPDICSESLVLISRISWQKTQEGRGNNFMEWAGQKEYPPINILQEWAGGGNPQMSNCMGRFERWGGSSFLLHQRAQCANQNRELSCWTGWPRLETAFQYALGIVSFLLNGDRFPPFSLPLNRWTSLLHDICGIPV